MPAHQQLSSADIDALAHASLLRYVTIPLLVAYLGKSPDAAYRLVRRLARGGFLRAFRWGRSSRHGPPSIVCTLTALGAAQLVSAGRADRGLMTRLVRTTSARARDIEAGLVTTLGHDLDVIQLHALLALAVRAQGGAILWWPSWGRRFRAPLDTDVTHFDAAERLRLLGDGRGTQHPAVTYLPDALVLLDDSDERRHVLLLEVETGKGGRTPEAIGAVKAAKMHAVWNVVRQSGAIDGLGPINPSLVTFATWCPSDRFRDGFLAGARRILGDRTLPLVATSATSIPLHLPTSLQKGQVSTWLSATAAPILGPVWLGLTGAATRLALVVGDARGPVLTTLNTRETGDADVAYDPFGPEPFIAL